jgi:hypothetical protein
VVVRGEKGQVPGSSCGVSQPPVMGCMQWSVQAEEYDSPLITRTWKRGLATCRAAHLSLAPDSPSSPLEHSQRAASLLPFCSPCSSISSIWHICTLHVQDTRRTRDRSSMAASHTFLRGRVTGRRNDQTEYRPRGCRTVRYITVQETTFPETGRGLRQPPRGRGSLALGPTADRGVHSHDRRIASYPFCQTPSALKPASRGFRVPTSLGRCGVVAYRG